MLRKCMLFIFVWLLIALPVVAQDNTLTVGAEAMATVNANVRSGPGEDYAIISTLARFAHVTVLDIGPNGWWARVQAADGTQGWVAARLLIPARADDATPSPNTAGSAQEMMTTVEANVRSGPGESHTVVATLARGTHVTVLDIGPNGWWARVQAADGTQGWVAARLLAAAAATGSASPPSAQPVEIGRAQSHAVTTEEANLYQDTSTDSGVVVTLSENMEVVIARYSADKAWAWVSTASGQGWIEAALLQLIGQGAPPPPGSDEATPEHAWVPDIIATPENPIIAQFSNLPGDVIANAHVIFQRGRALGNRANTFIKIGDSNMAHYGFFCNFQWGSYQLGPYAYLQSTVDFYNQSGSFCAPSQTALPGYATVNLIDPLWANPSYCYSGESSLECEIRRKKPSVAFIYIGLADMRYSTLDIFAANFDQIVRTLVEHGVVPVVQTLATADATTQSHGVFDLVPRYNAVIRDTAARYTVPLIDVRAATAPLPNQGCLDEGYHLSFIAENWMSFNGEEFTYGRHMRELLSLQVLHTLRLQAFH